MSDAEARKELFHKLNQETAKIPWQEMQRFFASGNALYVDESLDLIDVAIEFSLDNTDVLQPLIEKQQLATVTDQQAISWIDNDSLVWAVVIAPWVLVQPVKSSS